MAKRYTDTKKWGKQFMRGLPPEYKLFWVFLCDECDHAGIWDVDIEVTEVKLGIKLSLQKIRGLFEEKVVEFDGGKKFFIPGFIEFQYGELSEKNRAHDAVLKLLIKYGLMKYLQVPKGAMDMVMEKEKVKVRTPENYVTPAVFLRQKIPLELDELNHKSGFDAEKFTHCLTQWSLKCEENGWQYTNEETDLKRLRAGFEKWLNTWIQNERKEKSTGGSKKRTGHNITGIVGAADAVLEQFARNSNNTGNTG